MFTLCIANLASLDLMTSKMCPIDQDNLTGLGAYEMSKYYYILNENGTKLSKILMLGTTLHFPTLYFND